jgi:predicted GNAT family acetyltransferase
MTGLRDNVDLGRFELDEQGHTAYADYRRTDDQLIIDYVESPPVLRGSGAAGRLMTAIAEEARLRGLKIVPICGYAAAWLRRSKDYRDLLA